MQNRLQFHVIAVRHPGSYHRKQIGHWSKHGSMKLTLLSESLACADRCPNTAVATKWIFNAMIRIENLTVFADRREVFVDGVLVELGYRAMDVLLILIEANGALVTKEKFTDQVWPTTIVGDNNLRVQVSTIRKMMGAHRKLLVSVPGLGYRLLRPVQPAQVYVQLLGHHSSLASTST
jgi:DNA-binding winged helix-turn-helix (wHTH) protein